MTAEKLQILLSDAAWFSQLGGPSATIRNPFDGQATWDWLPTSREQPDPVHGDAFVKVAANLGRHDQRREAELAAAGVALRSLRTVPDRLPGLVNGPHDLTPAAKGGAVYAARMAAREITVERAGFWCDVARLFNQGYWPCGLDEAGRLVVY